MNSIVTKEVRAHAEISLSGVLPAKTVEQFYEKAAAEAIKHVSVPGFRRGHVPKERVIEEVGVNFLWRDAAERALKEQLEDILKKEEVQPIAPLSLNLMSDIKYGEDVSFEIVAITAPTVKIDDYKERAKKALDTLPTEDTGAEEAAAQRAFRTQVRAIVKMRNPEEVQEGDAKENEEKANKALSDEEAKGVGFENGKAAEHFIEGEAKKAVRDRALQKKRAAVADALVSAATASVPRVLVEEEALSLLETFKKDIAAQGLAWSEYLKRVGKGEEAVKEDLSPSAEKRIILDLVFGHIIRQEKLELLEEDKKKEEEFAHKLVEQGAPHERAHRYARESFMREKVWELLLPKADSPS